MPAHDPRWPDKVMSAALLVMMGGALAVAFALLRWAGATIDVTNAPLLTEWPGAIMAGAGIVALVAGTFAYIHQAWVLVALGIVANLVSLGFLGVSTLIGVVAIWPLVRSFMEREETRLDRRRMHAHQWPDKAIMASTLMSAGGAVMLMAGLLLVSGRIESATGLPSSGWGAILVAASIVVFIAARQTFHLRRAWLAWSATILMLLTGAFYFVGPALAMATGVFLWLAEHEAEFVDENVATATPSTSE